MAVSFVRQPRTDLQRKNPLRKSSKLWLWCVAQDGPKTVSVAMVLHLPSCPASPATLWTAPLPQLTWHCGGGGSAHRRRLRGAAALSHQAGVAAAVLSLDEQLSRSRQRDGVADAQFFLLGLLPSQGHLEAQGSRSSSSTPQASLVQPWEGHWSPTHPRHDSLAPDWGLRISFPGNYDVQPKLRNGLEPVSGTQ